MLIKPENSLQSFQVNSQEFKHEQAPQQNSNQLEDQNNQDQDSDEDYGEEIIDLGNDLQPFSMSFNKPTLSETDLRKSECLREGYVQANQNDNGKDQKSNSSFAEERDEELFDEVINQQLNNEEIEVSSQDFGKSCKPSTDGLSDILINTTDHQSNDIQTESLKQLKDDQSSLENSPTSEKRDLQDDEDNEEEIIDIECDNLQPFSMSLKPPTQSENQNRKSDSLRDSYALNKYNENNIDDKTSLEEEQIEVREEELSDVDNATEEINNYDLYNQDFGKSFKPSAGLSDMLLKHEEFKQETENEQVDEEHDSREEDDDDFDNDIDLSPYEQQEDQKQEEEEDYGDEVVDLGDDIQPFSMSFKRDYSEQNSETNKRGCYAKNDEADTLEITKDNDASPMQNQKILESTGQMVRQNSKDKEKAYIDFEKDDDYYENKSDQHESPQDSGNNSLQSSDEKPKNDFAFDDAMFSKFSSSYKFNFNDFHQQPSTSTTNQEDSDDFSFEPIQDDTFDFDDEPVTSTVSKSHKHSSNATASSQNPMTQGFQGQDKLALMKAGQELDLRKPVSVEKTFKDKVQVDIIQHQGPLDQAQEGFELMTDKQVKILKQTKNEQLEQRYGQKNSDDSDDSLDRNSEGSFKLDDDLISAPKYDLSKIPEQNSIIFNEQCEWQTSKKFERWIIIDPARPQQELIEKAHPQPKQILSKRLPLIMEKILQYMQQRNPKLKKKTPKPHKFGFFKRTHSCETKFNNGSTSQEIQIQASPPENSIEHTEINANSIKRIKRDFWSSFEIIKPIIIIESPKKRVYEKVVETSNNILVESVTDTLTVNEVQHSPESQMVREVESESYSLSQEAFSQPQLSSLRVKKHLDHGFKLKPQLLDQQPPPPKLTDTSTTSSSTTTIIKPSQIKKFTLAKSSIQFIQSTQKDRPQRSSSSAIGNSSSQVVIQKVNIQQIPARLIKVKLQNTTALQSQEGKPIVVQKVLSKSIQSRIKELQTVANPTLLKFKQPVPLGQIPPPTKHIGNENNSEIFEVVKQNLLAQKRQKADLFKVTDQKSAKSRISQIIDNHRKQQPLEVQDFDSKEDHQYTSVEGGESKSRNQLQHTFKLTHDSSLEEIQLTDSHLPPPTTAQLGIPSRNSKDLKLSILAGSNSSSRLLGVLGQASNHNPQLSPQTANKPMKVKKDMNNTEEIKHQIESVKEQKQQQKNNNFFC